MPVDLSKKDENYPENLGQWVFGTLKYKGHYIQKIDREYEITDHISIYLPPIDKVVQLVELGLQEVKKAGFIFGYEKIAKNTN